MGACREMRLPRSESESQSMSFSGALDSALAAAAPAPATPAAGQSSSTYDGLFWPSPRRFTRSRAASRQLPFRYASPAGRAA